MKVPKMKSGEHINSYIRRVEEYRLSLNKEKYDILLKLINEWIDKEYKSLSEFKNIKSSKLVKNLKHNRDILRKYSPKLTKHFKSKFSVEEDTDSDDITDNYIIYVVSKLLGVIDYKLISKKVGDIAFYSIIQV